MDEVKKILKETYLFSDAEDAVETTEFSPVSSFKKGEIIYNPENFKKSIGVIIKGKAKATEASGEGLLTKFTVGSVFGAAAVFGNTENYISRIVATSDCIVQFIEQEKLTVLFSKYKKVCENYISFLSSRIRFLNERLSIMMQEDVEGKIYSFLLKNEGYDGKMTALADTLCIGRTSLYRGLENLEQKNLIVRNDGKIKVIL
ncbi:MAG: Crp/Fnr family transcriptional regulator [Ruminococcaceae bacterium]|nr:Crp/Fnr family transcriptional regulator [Oscillospiraceae bacterium]